MKVGKRLPPPFQTKHASKKAQTTKAKANWLSNDTIAAPQEGKSFRLFLEGEKVPKRAES